MIVPNRADTPLLFDFTATVLAAVSHADVTGRFRRQHSPPPDKPSISTIIEDMLRDWTQHYTQLGYIGEAGSYYNGEKYVLLTESLTNAREFYFGLAGSATIACIMKYCGDRNWRPISTFVHETITGWSWIAPEGKATFFWDPVSNVSMQPYHADTRKRVVTHLSSSTLFNETAILRSIASIRGIECDAITFPALAAGLIHNGSLDSLVYDDDNAAVAASATLIIERSKNGVVTDFWGNESSGFTLHEVNGRPCFSFSDGLILTRNRTLTDTLVEAIASHL